MVSQAESVASTLAEDDNAFEFINKADASPGYDMTLNRTLTSEVGSKGTFDKESFIKAYPSAKKEVINPEKRVKKLLLQLIDLYTEVFDPKNFSESVQKITNTDAIPALKEKLKKLRALEYEKLGSVTIVFESIFDTEEDKKV